MGMGEERYQSASKQGWCVYFSPGKTELQNPCPALKQNTSCEDPGSFLKSSLAGWDRHTPKTLPVRRLGLPLSMLQGEWQAHSWAYEHSGPSRSSGKSRFLTLVLTLQFPFPLVHILHTGPSISGGGGLQRCSIHPCVIIRFGPLQGSQWERQEQRPENALGTHRLSLFQDNTILKAFIWATDKSKALLLGNISHQINKQVGCSGKRKGTASLTTQKLWCLVVATMAGLLTSCLYPPPHCILLSQRICCIFLPDPLFIYPSAYLLHISREASSPTSPRSLCWSFNQWTRLSGFLYFSLFQAALECMLRLSACCATELSNGLPVWLECSLLWA